MAFELSQNSCNKVKRRLGMINKTDSDFIKRVISINCLILLLATIFSASAQAAKTYVTTGDVDVYDAPNGEIIATWPSHTLFTSNKEDTAWIRVSGHFPEGEWQSIFPMWYVKADSDIQVRTTESVKAPATVYYKSLPENTPTARAYKLLESADVFDEAGNLITTWSVGVTFTSAYENDQRVKVTGTFPDGSWQKLDSPVWLNKPVRMQDRSQPKLISRTEDTRRFVVIDKNVFSMTLFEQSETGIQALMTSPVALGYDRCLPASQGGKCYYTPEGEFDIEFKLFDTDGIRWCIPKKMEGEFADKIAKGQRCWRGIMGNHALHFGNSLFLHGTSNPNSIGSKTTHGCVRMRNEDIEMVYRLLAEGDKVIVTSQFNDVLARLYAEYDGRLDADTPLQTFPESGTEQELLGADEQPVITQSISLIKTSSHIKNQTVELP